MHNYFWNKLKACIIYISTSYRWKSRQHKITISKQELTLAENEKHLLMYCISIIRKTPQQYYLCSYNSRSDTRAILLHTWATLCLSSSIAHWATLWLSIHDASVMSGPFLEVKPVLIKRYKLWVAQKFWAELKPAHIPFFFASTKPIFKMDSAKR